MQLFNRHPSLSTYHIGLKRPVLDGLMHGQQPLEAMFCTWYWIQRAQQGDYEAARRHAYRRRHSSQHSPT